MGLFSSKKTYVSSTVYNMAGDITKRKSYLKTLVLSHIIRDDSRDLNKAIQKGYLKGPGIKLRNFAKWAEDNYTQIGVPKGNLFGAPDIDPDLISPLVPKDSNQKLNVQRTEFQSADYSYWAVQWMLEHRPDEINSEWVSDFNEDQNLITITFADMSSVTFTPYGYDKTKTYLYVLYNLIRGQELGPTVSGSIQNAPYPSISGWTLLSNNSHLESLMLQTITKTTKSYSDNRPVEVTTDNSTNNAQYEYLRSVYSKSEYQGADPGIDNLNQIDKKLYLFRNGSVQTTTSTTQHDEDAGGGVTRHVLIETSTESLAVQETYRIDTQEKTRQSFSASKMLIYRMGSGVSAALDDKLDDQSDDGFYFPFLPVRINNVMVSPNYHLDVYYQNVEAYRKLTGSRDYDSEIVDKIKSNQDIGDMDYVYIMLGASLNTKENAAKKYLFAFFDRLRLNQQISESVYNQWTTNQNTFADYNAAWTAWRDAQSNANNPLWGKPMPTTGTAYSLPMNQIHIQSEGLLSAQVVQMDIRINWQTIRKTTGYGKLKPNSKIGQCYVEYGNTKQFDSSGYIDGETLDIDPIYVDGLVISQQLTANTWAKLTITGLVHQNFIYNGKYVETYASAAMADTEESGFIIPLHYDVFKSLSIVDQTQLSTACCYVVINSYKVVKKGFFQSGFFKILLIVAVIAITVATGGTGAGSVGLLGTNAAVGAAIGVTGTIGVIVGAVANAIAAMLLVKIITAGATAILGDKIGAIIGAIAGVIALQVGTSLASGNSLAQSFGNLLQADKIIAMTSAVGNGVAGYVAAGAQQTIQKTIDVQNDYKQEKSRLDKLYEETIGYDRAQLDPLLLLDSSRTISYEGANTFLQRTLMTGNDVADFSLNMLSDFANITLSTELDL